MNTTTNAIPRLFAAVCDDAAIFPPGNLPLAAAVPAHVAHRRRSYADMVGPLVIGAANLRELAGLTGDLPDGALELLVTTPLSGVKAARSRAEATPAVRLVGLEVVLADDTAPGQVVPVLEEVASDSITVHVEVPRDDRRDGVLAELAGTTHTAKFRTGGVRADLYPDEAELAASVIAAVHAGVPFKATAGLHHAIRNTDPATGFEQHGFLNLLTATGAALDGAGPGMVEALLAERDGHLVAAQVAGLSAGVREAFRTFGTCSITDPLMELADLGLLDPQLTENLA